MSNALATTHSNIVAIGGDSWSDDRKEFIRKNFCGNAPDQYIEPFIALCERRNLSPEAKHVYLVPRWNSRTKKEEWVPQLSIDGYRLIAARTGLYAGSDEAIYQEGEKYPVKATVTVWKVVGGVRCPFTASAYWEEYVPKEGQDFMWKKLPHVMLAKVAESAALRKAFPEDLSGTYTEEEMQQATSTIRDVTTEHPRIAQNASTAAQANDSDDFDVRLYDALAMPKDAGKRAINELQKEAFREKDAEKVRKLIKLVPSFEMAEWILNTATDKYQINTDEMIAELENRADNPDTAEDGEFEVVED